MHTVMYMTSMSTLFIFLFKKCNVTDILIEKNNVEDFRNYQRDFYHLINSETSRP